ncbi:hypothetical protein JG688_00014683, partial [Phytophthora aleatoria]
ETLSGEATYESASDLLGQFKQVLPDRRPKQQIAYKVAQLPPGKPITDASKFTRVFARELLRKCDAKMIAFQRTPRGLAGRDIAV